MLFVGGSSALCSRNSGMANSGYNSEFSRGVCDRSNVSVSSMKKKNYKIFMEFMCMKQCRQQNLISTKSRSRTGIIFASFF